MSGMLWLMDDSKTPLKEKIETAVDYFQRKYGVLPAAIDGSSKNFKDETAVAGYTIVPSTTVLPLHLVLQFPEGFAVNARGVG